MLAHIKEMIEINPAVKLQKGKSYPLIDIDKIIPGIRSVCSKELITYQGQSGCKFQNGDTLMARITPCLENGKIAQAKIDADAGIGSTELFVFRNRKDKTDGKWVYYFISSPYVRLSAINSMTGASGRQRADKFFIERLKFDFPDLPTQEKIASILSAYDDAIENNNKRIKILEKMAENLYREWFVRMRFPGHETAEYENGLPKGWSVQKVGEIVSRLPFNKLYKKSDLLPDGNVIVVDQSAEEYIGFHNDEPSHFSDINHPIIIFGDHSCKYQLMTQNFSLGENVVPFTGKNCNTIFLFYAIRGIVTTTEYKRHWGELITKKILFPQIELQNKFAKMIAPCLQLERQLSSNNYNLTKQRNYQLLRLMSGKMEVTSR